MTAPSTIKPKSSAPKLIRLAETPVLTMPVIVASMERGMTAAVIKAALKLPSKANSTTMTSSAPSSRFLVTVAMALSTSCVRSYTGSTVTPSGRESCMASSLRATSRATVRELAPISIIAVPSTVSLPSCVAAPERRSLPIPMSATSRIFIGTLSRSLMMTLPMSSTVGN